jgi:hypothetical protein
MRKFYLLSVLMLVSLCSVNAQVYNNEWISFVSGQTYSNQQYFRINIWKKGIFKVTYNDLQNYGVPVNSWFSPDRYQIFHDGKEQFINVVDADQNSIFNAGDYIEFFGDKNDGTFDAQIYDDPSSQPNQYQSLFNDTAAYFLSYNLSAITNKRMIVENDQNFGLYPTVPFLRTKDVRVSDAEYNIAFRDGNKIADNSYMLGEGWYFGKMAYGGLNSFTFNTNKLNVGVNPPQVSIAMMGANALSHPYTVTANGTTVGNYLFYGYDLNKQSIAVNNAPANGQVVINLVPDDDVTNPINENYINTGYVKFEYDRTTDFTGETFPQEIFLSAQGSKATINFSNTGLTNPKVYVVGNDTIRIISVVNNGGNFSAVIPAYTDEQKIYIINSGQAFSLSGNMTIEPVNRDPDPAKYARFNNFLEQGMNADFLIVSNKAIWTGAKDYASYRATKGFTPLLADVNELYDQYAWGIRKHPQAIRSFADQLIDMAVAPPKYLLLLGKGVMITDSKSGVGYGLNLVPTWGEPASDQLFTAHLNTNEYKTEIATGRVSAQSDADVTAYLNKLIEFENNQLQPPALWMKNVLHFGGGSNQDEQDILSAKLHTYAELIQDTLFGGNVYTFLKNSNAPIQINQSEYLQALIDSGCTMMTFYGHAAGTSFDNSTDAPENYSNKGRYPIVLAQSCFVGDIFTTQKLLNERFVLTPDKAAIGFIAVPDKGIIEELDTYSSELHQQMFRTSYGKGVAESMKNAVANIMSSNAGYKNVCMSMTLHGDPAVKMNQFELPDYSVDNSSISFEPSVVTTEIDSFKVKIAVTNLGENTNQSMSILFSRTMPDGITKRDTIIQVPYVTYRDTFEVKLPVDFKDGAGLNTFQITVDNYNDVAELNESSNNVATTTLQITSTDINPVYPQEYAIIPTSTVTLKATTANLFAAPKNYRFELDTSAVFSSPSKISGVVANAFGVVSWTPNIALTDSEVYYWRVANDSIMSPDTAISNDFQWKQSSFMYKQGITGWSQADYPQFSKDNLTNMIRQDASRYFEYVSSQFALTMTHVDVRPSYEINGSNMDYGGCNFMPQIAVAVLDSVDFEHPWQTDSCIRYYGNYNYFNCNTFQGCNRPRPDKFFLFNTAVQSQTDSLISMITNKIPDGDYLLSWTVFGVGFDTLNDLKAGFANIGVPQYSTLTNADKYMLFMKKGDPSSVIFKKGVYPTEDLRIDYALQRDWDKGFYTSTKIGPSTGWTSVHWDYASTETGFTPDSVLLDVYGINTTGQEILLMSGITQSQKDFAISSIDAAQYPYLKLKMYTEDLINRTPPQLVKWQVYFSPVPEGTLNTKYYSFASDTLQEGEKVSFNIAFENISSVDMDTLLVDYYLFDQNNVRRDLATVRLNRPLAAGDTVMTGISFSTRDFLGDNVLWVEANPRHDQPEQYHFNNLANVRFHVTRDITNPLLDVTFDGTHILNGDIVSARPNVTMQLLDENKFIALNDTGNFRVTLTAPDGVVSYLHFEPVSGTTTSADLLKWIPASLPKNSFRIDYNPLLTKDGVYELDVQAKDESGNLSGALDYKIQFEVVNKSSITEVVNYPNPFSTSTRFVFVLTGSEIPDDFRIRIMTVTGKIVREITRQEIGDIHIGRNISEYAWDGKDEFGDQLANGVYLYRVYTGINGSEIEKKETALDAYFKKGWGKMYLMR